MAHDILLYHASVQGIAGIAMPLDPEMLFFPTDDTRAYVVQHPLVLTMHARVDDAMMPSMIAMVEARLADSKGAHYA